MRRISAPRGVSSALTALATAALLGPLGASSAAAAPFVDITYDLGDSSADAVVTVPLAQLVLKTLSPPQVLSGSMKIRYASDSASGLVPGPSTLLTFNLSVRATAGLTYATVSGATGQLVANTGTLRFHLVSPVAGGTLLPGGTVDPLGGIGQILLSGTIHCYVACAGLVIPASTPVPIDTDPTGVLRYRNPFSQPLAPLYGAVGTPHTVTGTQYAVFLVIPERPPLEPAANAKVYATTFLVGREVLREPVVPEPGTLPLLGLGLGVAGLWALRHRLTGLRC